MNLKEGIHLYSELPAIREQLSINSGTVLPTADTGLNYYPGSYIPKREWRALNDHENRLLLAGKSDHTRCIYVGEIPASLKEAFVKLGLHTCTHLDQVYPKLEESEEHVKAVTDELHTFLRPFSAGGQYKFHRVTRAMPNRETITCHYLNETFTYIGLHIDQSKDFKLHTAYKSGNRISINLSREARSLVFINLSLIQVCNMLREKINMAAAEVSPYNVAYHFFKHFPDYPAVKILLQPYQYYVAPTDNFFHDASTRGNREIDVTIVYTGVFDMPHLKN